MIIATKEDILEAANIISAINENNITAELAQRITQILLRIANSHHIYDQCTKLIPAHHRQTNIVSVYPDLISTNFEGRNTDLGQTLYSFFKLVSELSTDSVRVTSNLSESSEEEEEFFDDDEEEEDDDF